MKKTILLTGATGYIGSRTWCVDNLSNSVVEVVGRVAEITQRQPILIEGDVRDAALLEALFSQHTVDAVIHFAGLKAVGGSVENQLAYYDTNLTSC